METPTSNNEEDDDVFLDALDEFPFYDCTSSLTAQSECSTSSSILLTPDPPTPTTLRRRSLSRRSFSGDDSKPSTIDSITDTKPSFRDHRRYRMNRNLTENENVNEKPEPTHGRGRAQAQAQAQSSNSTITTETYNRVIIEDSADSASDFSFNWLILIAGFIIKAITFQINLFITFTSFPFFLLYHSYTLIINPYQTLRRVTDSLIQNLSVSKLEALSPWLREHQWVWNAALRCGWGILSSLYVCVVLCCLLLSSIMVSFVLMRYLVEEPIRMNEVLNFDYTKHSPVAYVPVVLCKGIGCSEHCKERLGGGLGFVPPTHRLQATVSMTLPESEYNRNLGIFQVRVDWLSASGKTLSSSSHPCMLKFRSEPIRFLLMFLKVAPLVAGYISESQTLSLKFRGFTEGDVPTACLKITIEQRAEYRPGAGIPEIYDASLILESELPLLKRIIWYWRKTIFIWISIMSFMMQLLFTLVCCRHVIIPKARPRDGSASSSATRNSTPVQSASSSATGNRPRDGSASSSATRNSTPVQSASSSATGNSPLVRS